MELALSPSMNATLRAVSPITVDVASPLRPTRIHRTFSTDGRISGRILNPTEINMRPTHSTPRGDRSGIRSDNRVPLVSPPDKFSRTDLHRHNNIFHQPGNPTVFNGRPYHKRLASSTDSTHFSLQRPIHPGINLSRGRSPAKSVSASDALNRPTSARLHTGHNMREYFDRSRSPSQRTFTSVQHSSPHFRATRSRSVDRSFSRPMEFYDRGHNIVQTRISRGRSPHTRSPISLLTAENKRFMRSQSVERSHFRRNSSNSFAHSNLSRPTSINLVEQNNRQRFFRPDRAESPHSIHTEGYNSPHTYASKNIAHKSPFSGSASVSIPYSQSYNIVSPPNKLNNSYTHNFRGPQRPLDQDFNPRPEPRSISSPSIRAHDSHKLMMQATLNRPRSRENRRQIPIEFPESNFTIHTIHSQPPSPEPHSDNHRGRKQLNNSEAPTSLAPGRIPHRIDPKGKHILK